MEQYLDLLAVLNGFIWGEAPVLSDSCNFESLYSMARKHSVSGILGYMSYLYPSLMTGSITERIRYDSAYTVGSMSLKEEQLSQIEDLLQTHHISYVLFKGAVVKDYYPVCELRTFGDVDVLIHDQDRPIVHDLFLQYGFQCTHNWEPVYSYRKSNAVFEVHTMLLDTQVSKCNDFFNENMWKYCHPIQNERYEFSDEFHFIYLMAHFAKHVKSSGAGVRMLLDLACMVKACQMDWQWIQKTLEETGLSTFSMYVFSALLKYWNCLCPIEGSVPEDIDVFMEYIMEAGTFGKAGRDEGVSALKNSSSRTRQILRYLFPSASTISTRYTYLQKHRYLLPAAWLHRFIITISKTGHHIDHVHAMIHADDEKVDHLRQLISKLNV